MTDTDVTGTPMKDLIPAILWPGPAEPAVAA
ncbi:hypothetical protein ABID21_000395 [Pseudorhizobium tarimense]|uniref:Uncharacterized protein n=1 Tax=Pseudorhizobium tarimense TaxID=1079109 RepID=A0ABV2H179_9HYPH